jgi:hypothetical protein
MKREDVKGRPCAVSRRIGAVRHARADVVHVKCIPSWRMGCAWMARRRNVWTDGAVSPLRARRHCRLSVYRVTTDQIRLQGLSRAIRLDSAARVHRCRRALRLRQRGDQRSLTAEPPYRWSCACSLSWVGAAGQATTRVLLGTSVLRPTFR